jgi:carboxymethylenebutenolidase
MKENTIPMGDRLELLHDGDHAMSVYRARPAGERGPVVIVLQEIFGVNAAMRAVADDLAAQGFVALAPDLFWRLEAGVELYYDQAGLGRAFDLWKRFDLDQGVKDVSAVVDYARKAAEGRPVALLGFCLGGQLAVRAGALVQPDAVVSFYGVKLQESLDAIGALTCPTLFHFGEADQHVPAAVRDAVSGVAADKPDMHINVYDAAGHGFFNRFRAQGFDQAAHDAAWPATLSLLRQAMAPERSQIRIAG